VLPASRMVTQGRLRAATAAAAADDKGHAVPLIHRRRMPGRPAPCARSTGVNTQSSRTDPSATARRPRGGRPGGRASTGCRTVNELCGARRTLRRRPPRPTKSSASSPGRDGARGARSSVRPSVRRASRIYKHGLNKHGGPNSHRETRSLGECSQRTNCYVCRPCIYLASIV